MTQLFINDTLVDTYEDVSIPLNKEIADIANPESRNSSYTKTITLPSTKVNDALFTYIFDVSSTVESYDITSPLNFFPDFNPNLKANCKIFVDQLLQMEGYVQLLQVNMLDGKMEYEIVIYGDLGNFFSEFKSDKLSKLYFTELDHTFNKTNVVNSWTATAGEGYVYPLIDYGYNDEVAVQQVYNMRPAIYAKAIVDKIFSTYGYTYQSGSFFETDLFKQLIVPYTGTEFGNSQVEIEDNHFTYFPASTYPTVNIGDAIVNDAEYNDVHNQFNTSNGEVTFYDSRARKFSGVISIGNTNLPDWGFTHVFRFYIDLVINNVVVYTIEYTGNLAGVREMAYDSGYQHCESGKVAKWILRQVTDITAGIIYTSGYNATIFLGVSVDINPSGIGDTVSMSTILPKDILIKDFMMGLVRMFNLYLEPTGVDKELKVLTREAYLTDEILDWSKKLDISQPIKIQPMGMLDANPYYFTYKADTDTYNKTYTDEYGLNYGDYRYYVNNDFIREEKKTEVCFSPTVLVRDPNYFSDLIYSSVRNYDTNGNLVVKGGNIRLLYYNYLPTSSVFTLIDGTTTYTYGDYPYAGHLDDPYSPTFDLNFGQARKIYYSNLDGSAVTVTSTNLFKTYYENFIKEITNKDSKMVTAFFRLRPLDILEADFSKIYYFMGQYFRLNKIKDHEVGKEQLTECEFIKTTIQAG